MILTRGRALHISTLLLIGACGSVSNSESDASNGDIDAQVCPGDVNDDGSCVCPPRTSGAACETCADGWSEADCSVFTDNFNRGSGAIGALYAPPTLVGVDEAVIVNNRACGDIQSVGLMAEAPLGAIALTASMTFSAPIADGFEGGFLLSGSADALSDFFIASCDGGGGNCQLRIGELTQAPLDTQDLTLAVDTTYLFTLTVQSRTATLAVTDNATSLAIGSVSGSLPAGFVIERFGFITGREPDGSLTCIDDFRLTL